MSTTVYVSAGVTDTNYYVSRLSDGKPFAVVHLAGHGQPYISSTTPGDLRALADVLTAAADALAKEIARRPGEPHLASCGHPADEDGECGCSSWPERAPEVTP